MKIIKSAADVGLKYNFDYNEYFFYYNKSSEMTRQIPKKVADSRMYKDVEDNKLNNIIAYLDKVILC